MMTVNSNNQSSACSRVATSRVVYYKRDVLLRQEKVNNQRYLDE